ncbi:helix-turn-helix domain-containing protein [Sneathiella aquimaris]|uniref:helix-turn-helix domain-containing protein n=1 Tax=Sneathiella aquimaris TaxID=2599305 RepID=UPI0015E17E3C
MNLSTHLVKRTVLSVSEFCAEAGIGRTKLYQEIAAGRIVARKSGRRTLIPTSELEKWLESLPELKGANS